MDAGLLSPLRIKGFELKNRIVLPPMQVDLATKDGFITDEQINHYAHYAKWVGLVIVEHTAISVEGRYSIFQLGIWSEDHVKKLSKLTEKVHDEGGVVVIQLNHAGGKAPRNVTNSSPKDPSGLNLPFYPEKPVEMTINDINKVIEEFAKAAERAYQAGFDGVEIHGAHGFLIDQFWSPITNRRNDEFGGFFRK